MAVFSYYAREAGTGREVRGTVDASSQETALALLRGRNLFVHSIRERINPTGTSSRKVKLIDLAAFTRQLSSMIDAGLTITQSLQTLQGQTVNRSLKEAIQNIIRQIDEGESFSGALQQHSDIFSRLYINMVDAGERGGILPDILARLASYSERTQKLQSKVRSAMIYPIVVLLVALGVTGFLMIQVVPTFSEIFRDMGAELPLFTQLVVAISYLLRDYLIWILIAAGFAWLGWRYLLQTPGGRSWWDNYKLTLPIFGVLWHKLALSRFARTTAALLHSGVPILEVLNIVSSTVDNMQMEKALKESAVKIEQGDTLSGALSAYPIFPASLLRMVVAGEQGGMIDSMLEKIADYMDEELENSLSSMTSLIEPILIVFLGIMIGGMVLAMFLPVFDLVNHIR